jgi:peptide-methionine (R)-S-oxide reductase
MNRRHFVLIMLAASTAPAALYAETFEVIRTDAEWRDILSPTEFAVMRQDGTERAGTSPLTHNEAAGIYYCRGCDLPLYPSRTQFDSGTGWPSFYASLDNAIGTKIDNTMSTMRTKVHCKRCGSHLGHIFNDGPAPTGKRHCLNGVSLTFRAA